MQHDALHLGKENTVMRSPRGGITFLAERTHYHRALPPS